jgi:hypothetical protein
MSREKIWIESFVCATRFLFNDTATDVAASRSGGLWVDIRILEVLNDCTPLGGVMHAISLVHKRRVHVAARDASAAAAPELPSLEYNVLDGLERAHLPARFFAWLRISYQKFSTRRRINHSPHATRNGETD